VTLQARVYTPEGVDRYDDIAAAHSATGETWIHADSMDETDLERLSETFGIHRLAIEDVREEGTRPKVEQFDTHTFVLLKTARLAGDDVAFHKEIHVSPVGLFVGPDWLVTLTTGDTDLVSGVAGRWVDSADRVATRGADFIAYRIIDGVVDQYFALLDELEDDIEAVEERVLDQADPQLLEALNDVRRDLLAFRKVAWPAREAIGTLSRGDVPQVADSNEKYFRDTYDHLVQVVDLIETYRDLTTGSRDIYLNTVSMSTNEVMKTLTVVATIFIPLTFVVGVYGMNFADSPYAMPELYWRFGYPAVMLGMGAVATIMLVHFRRQDWL
jgi:magnesium transporter